MQPKAGGWVKKGLSRTTSPQPLGKPQLVFLKLAMCRYFYIFLPGSLESLSGFGFHRQATYEVDPESTPGRWT